jgi:hypothetical protein
MNCRGRYFCEYFSASRSHFEASSRSAADQSLGDLREKA